MEDLKKFFVKRNLFLLSLLSAFFWVVFMWNFWGKGIFAFGFNASVYLLIIIFAFLYVLYERSFNIKKHLKWLIPVLMIAISFSLFENPFLKIINLLIIPFILGSFFSYTLIKRNFLKNKEPQWSLSFYVKTLLLNFTLFEKFDGIFQEIKKIIVKKPTKKGGVRSNKVYNVLSTLLLLPKRGLRVRSNKVPIHYDVLLGLFFLIVISFIVILPLLGSADSAFGEKIDFLFEWLRNNVGNFFGKTLMFLALFFLTFAASLNWLDSKKFQLFSFTKKLEISIQRGFDSNSIIRGVVLLGIFLIYVVFIQTQIERFFIKSLPMDLSETQAIVKSGFWQLIFLSIINVIFFFLYYKKTNKTVQRILTLFTVSSLLLVASAGYRMFLYVRYYGFSYEKFFAAYTILYIGLLFVWLLFCLFQKRKKDLFKYLIFSSLWMYSVLTVMPVERFIFKTNIELQKLPNSRIELYQLRMLSSDVADIVKNHRNDEEWRRKWSGWQKNWEKRIEKKKWYEKNVSNLSSF